MNSQPSYHGAQNLLTMPNFYSFPGFKVWDGSESRETSIGSLSSLLLSEAPPPIADVPSHCRESEAHLRQKSRKLAWATKFARTFTVISLIPVTFKVSPCCPKANLASEVSFEFFESFSFDFASSRARAACGLGLRFQGRVQGLR